MASRVKAASNQSNELPLFCNRIAFQEGDYVENVFLSYLNTWGAALATEWRRYNNAVEHAEMITRHGAHR